MTSDVEVVRAVYDRVLADLAGPAAETAYIELSDPDVEVDLSRQVFNPGVHRGHDAIRDSMGDVREAWETFTVTPEDFIEA
jgi:ketosteroid isomerase-like protein